MLKFILRHRLSVILSLSLAVSFGAGPASSRPGSAESPQTKITSERMTVRNKDNQAVFEGTVVLTRGPLVVHSDVMVVYYEPRKSEGGMEKGVEPNSNKESKAANLSVSRIEATGKVRIQRGEGKATCQKAVFYQDEQKIVLSGKPVAWQKGNIVKGRQITMFLAEDRTVVEGGSQVLLEEGVSGE